ncbi:MAG TPA: HAD-IB family phosphatase [Candidatus Limnocylindrales bacterium]|nr:HAD-IB family phosphatase [Candidatus Limnocylindrales bacterium]
MPPPEAGGAPVSFLVDYDGTIAIDVGDELLKRHYDNKAEIARLDALYDDAKIGSRELMRWDMDVLPRDADMLRRDAAAMPQDETFRAFVEGVRGHGAVVEIVSDGLGFYVQPNLAQLGLGDLFVATNENRVENGGEGLSFPFGHPSCFVCGTCKRERVRLHQAAGRVVVFIGDGTSDRYAAAHADLVFAKGSLARICADQDWPFHEWDRFDQVLAEVARAFADGRLPRDVEDLPVWRGRHAHAARSFICGPEVWGPGRTTPGPGPH